MKEQKGSSSQKSKVSRPWLRIKLRPFGDGRLQEPELTRHDGEGQIVLHLVFAQRGDLLFQIHIALVMSHKISPFHAMLTCFAQFGVTMT
jgi:hypothetical protein